MTGKLVYTDKVFDYRVYEIENGYVISECHSWLPGVFETLQAAIGYTDCSLEQQEHLYGLSFLDNEHCQITEQMVDDALNNHPIMPHPVKGEIASTPFTLGKSTWDVQHGAREAYDDSFHFKQIIKYLASTKDFGDDVDEWTEEEKARATKAFAGMFNWDKKD